MPAKITLRILTILFLFFCTTNISFSQLTKEEIIILYREYYLSSEIDSVLWNGNTKKCQCGTLSKELYEKAEDRVNFFRLATGLQKVKINPDFNQEAQDAALLVKANNLLTHTPSKDLKCYSQSAYNGCNKSCLGTTNFKSFPQTSFITSFIRDYGASNYYVGHRKWILYSKLRAFGYGATNASEALLTANGVSYFDTIPAPEYIAYPWSGYVPVNLIFPKWSFSLPAKKNVDFSKATITMTDPKGALIKLEKLPEYKNYLDPTLVWEVKGLFSESDINYGFNNMEQNGFLNKKIKVSIKNVSVDGKLKNFEYFVEAIKI